MKKLIALTVILALAVSMFAGCGSKAPSQAPQTPEAPAANGDDNTGGETEESGDPIKIGYVGALSGDTALWGQAGLNGMLLTAEKVNAAGGVLGRPIQIVGLDGRGDPQDSVNAYNKLVDEEKVVAIVGTNFSSCNIPMAAVADQKKVPLIATAASNPLVTVDENGNLHPYSFRLCFIDSFQGSKMAEYAIANGHKTAAILVDIGDSYSTGIAEFTAEAFEKGGGTIVAREEANTGDNDYRAQLSKIKQSNPDVLFIPWIYSEVALIAKQARELGLECEFYGFDGWDSFELPDMAAGALEGALYCSRPGFATPEAQAYGDEYLEKYNIALEAECLFGNDAVLWIVQCIEAAGSAESEAIRDELENTKEFVGLIGRMSIEAETHNPERELAIFEVKGSKNELKEFIG